MPTNVPLNEYGQEDPDEFFKSSPAVNTRSHATPNRGGHYPTSSPPMPPPSSVRRRPRMSDLHNDSDEDGTDSLAADGLLDDEYEVDKITPPPLKHQSSPNPPASVAQRARLPDESPFRLPPGRRKSTIGVNFNPSTPGSSRRANGLNSPFRHVEQDMVDINAAFDDNHLEIQVAEEVETFVDENGDMPDEEQDEQEDSQPVGHRRRRSSNMLRGPHPPISSGVADSFEEPIAEELEDQLDGSMDEDDVSDPGQPFVDASDIGEPFHDNGPNEPMDYVGDGPIDDEPVDDEPVDNGPVDDDTDLEERAMAAENEDGEEEADDGFDKENEPPQEKRGTKRTATAGTPQKKTRARKSQLPIESENQYTGTFKMRRSQRVHFAPLRWWANEHFEYKRGENGPEIIAAVEIPEERIVVRPRTVKGRARSRGRSKSTRAYSASVAPESDPNQFFDIDKGIDTMMPVNDYASREVKLRKTFLPSSLISTKPVTGSAFHYQKAFGEDGFIAGGIVLIDPGHEKPSKPSHDNVYIFVVLVGAVEVTIADNIFQCGTHSSFMVPRGNNYRIMNKYKVQAKLFFSQGRKVTQKEVEAELDKEREIQRWNQLRAERAQDRVDLDPEDFEDKWGGWHSGPEEEAADVESSRGSAEGLSDEGEGRSEPETETSYMRAPPSPTTSAQRDPSITLQPSEPEAVIPKKRGPGRPRKSDKEAPDRVMAKSTRGRKSLRGGRGRGGAD